MSLVSLHACSHDVSSSDGQRGAPGKRKRGPASDNDGSGGPILKQPKLLDCLFDDEELSPIQAKGATCICDCVYRHYYHAYMYIYIIYYVFKIIGVID